MNLVWLRILLITLSVCAFEVIVVASDRGGPQTKGSSTISSAVSRPPTYD